MKSRQKTHITQFSWKAAGMDQVPTRVSWRDFVSSCRTGESKTADLSCASPNACQDSQERGHDLPGRFPGAMPYVSFRRPAGLRACKQVEHHGRSPNNGVNTVNSVTWYLRSE
jgi:hypothetical protein